jgi:hypothetical protein
MALLTAIPQKCHTHKIQINFQISLKRKELLPPYLRKILYKCLVWFIEEINLMCNKPFKETLTVLKATNFLET